MPSTTSNTNKMKTRRQYEAKEKYALCKEFEESSVKTYSKFIRDKGLDVNPTVFGRWYKEYEDGQIDPESPKKKNRPITYPKTEEKFVSYLKKRAELCVNDRVFPNHEVMLEIAREYNKEFPEEKDFEASKGWLHNVLKRHNFIAVKLTGEADSMTDEESERIMIPWRLELKKILDELSLTNQPSHIYNADQSGLLYAKLPNRLFVRGKEEAKKARGCKRMTDKSRLTMMLCTSAIGRKTEMCIVGKAKTPMCFSSFPNKKPPLKYTNQKNAWFDLKVRTIIMIPVFLCHNSIMMFTHRITTLTKFASIFPLFLRLQFGG